MSVDCPFMHVWLMLRCWRLADIRTFEVLLRSYEVREERLENWQSHGGSFLGSSKKEKHSIGVSNEQEGSTVSVLERPSSEGKGHTGYLTFARLKCVT